MKLGLVALHLVAVSAVSAKAVCSDHGAVGGPAAKVKVVARLAVEQVGVGEDDAGALAKDVVHNFVDSDALLLNVDLPTIL